MNLMRIRQHSHPFSRVQAVRTVLLACSLTLIEPAGVRGPVRCSAELLPPVTVEGSSQWNGTVYRISSGNCTMEWISRDGETGVVKHGSSCALPLSQQLPLLTKLCAEFLQRDKNAESFRILFWGGLIPDGPRSGPEEMSLRLALAAYASPEWNPKSGRPKNGDFNGFVKDIANKALIYPELKELFERFHRTIAVPYVEKVRVLEAAKLPFYDQLSPHGIQATDKLPFDCMTWFSVSEVLQGQGGPP
jgi:hypothetical protein